LDKTGEIRDLSQINKPPEAVEHVEGETLSRYLLFHYNCWEYDYYEEPLIAIVASILDQIDEKVDLIPENLKERILAVLKVLGKGLVKKTIQIVDDKAGINLEKTLEILKEGGEAAEATLKESHEYDQYFDFKKTLKELKKTIAELSENQTIIFVVDELDRCLPEYTIKVLERLHHLFDGISNVQVLLSIDIAQLKHVVRQIYGDETDVKNYLRKFIQFEVFLGEGVVNDKFNERFKQYTSHFQVDSSSTSAIDVDEFKTIILAGIDMRSRISIVDRCLLIHSLSDADDTLDLSYMCLELLLVVLNDYGIDVDHAKNLWQHRTICKARTEISV